MDAFTRKIIDRLLEWGADLVGIAPVERFSEAPSGHRPTDFMPECRSVISIGLHLFQGSADVWTDDPRRMDGTNTPYLFYGYGLTNLESSRIVNRMAKILEYRGHKSLCFLPTWFTSMGKYFEDSLPSRKMMAEFSHRHAAVAAGLAEFGWNGLAMTPEFGAMQRFNTILTDAQLEPTPLYDGPAICRREECGTKCVQNCPAKAYSEEEVQKMNIDGRSISYAAHDAIRCTYGIYGLIKGSGGRSDIRIPDGPGDILHLQNSLRGHEEDPVGKEMRKNCFGLICGDFCGKCLHQCPGMKLAEKDLADYDMSVRNNALKLDIL